MAGSPHRPRVRTESRSWLAQAQSLDRWVRLAAAALVNVRQELPDGLGASWNGQRRCRSARNSNAILPRCWASRRRLRLHRGRDSSCRHRRMARSASSSTLRRHNSPRARCRQCWSTRWCTSRPAHRIRLRRSGRRKASLSGFPRKPIRASEAKRPTKCCARTQRRCAPLIPLRPAVPGRRAAISELAYAEAWLACRYIADQYSETQLGRFYAELARGRSVDEASRSTLQLSEAELTAGWRAYLVRLAQY